jgi:hypothetical protein
MSKTPIADMIEKMHSGGIPVEFIVLAVRTAELVCGQRIDNAAERRRAWDRARKAERKNSTGIPLATGSVCVKTLQYIDSKQAREIPNSAFDEATAFARGIGWLPDRIADQWQRFRDYNLTHSKRPKDIMAAWRNWCRSPYRKADEPKVAAAAAPSAFAERWAANTAKQLAEREAEEKRRYARA